MKLPFALARAPVRSSAAAEASGIRRPTVDPYHAVTTEMAQERWGRAASFRNDHASQLKHEFWGSQQFQKKSWTPPSQACLGHDTGLG